MRQFFLIKTTKLLNLLLIVSCIFCFCFSSFAVNSHKTDSKGNNDKKSFSFSMLTISKVNYKNKVLIIAGDTDLPDKSILQIKVIPDNGTAKNSIFAKTVVKDSKYNCDIGIPQKTELYKGPYKIVVSFILEMQNSINVLHQVGNGADNLSGDLVQREPITDYKILQCSEVKPLFALQMERYSLDDPEKFIHDAPKYVLLFFLTNWSENDWKGMSKYSYAPWVKDTDDPVKLLKKWFGSVKLVGVEFLEEKVGNSLMKEYVLKLFYIEIDNKSISNKPINVKVIKNDEGKWGVFPPSIIEQHAIFNMNFK